MTVAGAEAPADLPRQAAFGHQMELVVEDHPRGACGAAGRRRIHANSALGENRVLRSPKELLQEYKGRVVADPAARFVAPRNQ